MRELKGFMKTLYTWLHPLREEIRYTVIASATLLLAFGVYLTGAGFGKPWPGTWQWSSPKIQQVVVWAAFTILAPCWFTLEYFIFGPFTDEDLAQFKHGQDQSAKIWIAVAAVMLTVFFGKDLANEKHETTPAVQVNNNGCL